MNIKKFIRYAKAFEKQAKSLEDQIIVLENKLGIEMHKSKWNHPLIVQLSKEIVALKEQRTRSKYAKS